MHSQQTTAQELSKRLYQVQLENREAIYNFEIATNNYDAVEIAQGYALSMSAPFTPHSPTFLTCCAQIGDYSEEDIDGAAYVIVSTNMRSKDGHALILTPHSPPEPHR